MLRKSLPLIFAILFVFAGLVDAAKPTPIADRCYISDVDASPDTFKAGQSINFKIQYKCQFEIDNVEIAVWHVKYDKDGKEVTQDKVGAKYGVNLGKGAHKVDVSGNGFRGGEGTFRVTFRKADTLITQKQETTMCKSWSLGRY